MPQDGKRPRDLDELVDRAIQRIVKSGRVGGKLVDSNDVRFYIGKGVRLLYNHANHLLAAGSKEFMELIDHAKVASQQSG